MSLTDPLADMLTRIRNGLSANLINVKSPSSKLKRGILEVLKAQGYIENYEETTENNIAEVLIKLKYYKGQPVIRKIQKVSKPGKRIYSQIDSLKKHYNGLGILILSTSKGVMTDHEATNKNIGGEILCNVY